MRSDPQKESAIQYQMVPLNKEVYNKLLKMEESLGLKHEIKNPEPIAPLLERIASIKIERVKQLLS